MLRNEVMFPRNVLLLDWPVCLTGSSSQDSSADPAAEFELRGM